MTHEPRTTDEGLRFFGAKLWPETYGAGMSDEDAYAHCVQHELQMATDGGYEPHPSWPYKYLFAAKWAQCGYPKITTSHKYAAALAATKLDRGFAPDLHVPGDAFVVAVPEGILEIDYQDDTSLAESERGPTRDYAFIAVAAYDGQANMMLMDRHTMGGVCQMVIAHNLADLLFEELDDVQGFGAEGDAIPDAVAKRRVALLARRLVVGLLLAMQDTANLQARPAGGAGKRRHRDEPKHRVTFVGRPIDVDCRPAIRDYLAGGRRSAPSVQTLVRGHHKRQVVGVGRGGRRVIWVQPYWRGPEDAPILSRPLRIGAPR